MWLVLVLLVIGVCFWLGLGRLDWPQVELLLIVAAVWIIAKAENGGGRI